MKKTEGFLKLIILYKTCMGLGELLISLSFARHLGESFDTVLIKGAIVLGFNLENLVVSWVIRQAGAFGENFVFGTVVVLFTFAVLNLVEAYGLHLRRRWAEWMTVIGTGALVPYEIYMTVESFSILKLLIVVINSVIVYYLAKHKELFKAKRSAGLAP